MIVATSDGGSRWTTQLSTTSDYFADITFVDARHGWAVGGAGTIDDQKATIVTTDDGGKTWRHQHADANGMLIGVAFSDVNHGWALIGHIGLLATEDGGKTWTVVTPLGKRDDGLCGITCFGPQASN
jgi:photosystem II stability/assembly factor-like uncharacterized protein